MKYHQFTV